MSIAEELRNIGRLMEERRRAMNSLSKEDRELIERSMNTAKRDYRMSRDEANVFIEEGKREVVLP